MLLSIASVWATGYFDTTSTRSSEWLKWIVAQLSIDQFYNPAFMRQYGTGSLNASTWTISVELQFYLGLPLVYAALGPATPVAGALQCNPLCLTVAFMAVTSAWVHVWDRSKPFFGLISFTFAPWFYMFLVGVLFQRNFELPARRSPVGLFPRSRVRGRGDDRGPGSACPSITASTRCCLLR